MYAATGVHPQDALKFESDSLDKLRVWLSHPKAVALGEIGLDYYYDNAPHEVQMRPGGQIHMRRARCARAEPPV